jgi:inhibitor of cysteine peptidase
MRDMAEIVVTEGSNGGALSAKVGDTLIVQLPETPATGFRWASAVADTATVALTGDDFQLGARSGVGGGGLRIFRFATKSPGSTDLKFKLARSWESGPPKAVFSVRVDAR